MADVDDTEGWKSERTTFQRVYDVVLGEQEFRAAAAVAERADCSETAARNALEQLVEMGIAERRDGRPANYRRNDAYLTWKRVDSLAREYTTDELRERLDELDAEDEVFQQRYGVAAPDAVPTADVAVADHAAFEERWADLGEWRTVRRDVRVLRRALRRAEQRRDDRARA